MIIDNKINQSRLSDDVVNNQTEYYYESGVIKSQKINQSVPCEDDGVLKANGSNQLNPPDLFREYGGIQVRVITLY